MSRIFTLFTGLLLTTLLFAQEKKTYKVDYDNDSRWFWGLNVGSTWTTADVKKVHDWGWGLTLGKSFNYNYGKVVSFDIRGRYLHGDWYGQDADTTGFQYGNQTLSSGSTDYDSILGYSVLNHKTEVHELSLELVLHLNRLRERTGWDAYIFGGIGYSWYRARGDLLGANDSIYRYDELTAYNATSVKGLLDEDYESVLDGSRSSGYSAGWMPSLGFGLGYQVGPRFSIGLEHKTTFTRLDHFDGSVNPTGDYANDWYHYTGAYFRWHIKDHRVEPVNTVENVNNYDQTTPVNQPPVVDFRQPGTSGTTVSNPTYVIQADVKNVPGVNNVIFQQNGSYITNFLFNPSTSQFEATVILNPGQNTFTLTGTNNYGSDQEQTVIIYNREENNPPVVTYINPASSPVTVQQPNFNVLATVLNVTQASQVAVQLNGTPFTGFSFTGGTNEVAAPFSNLLVGTNIVTITGTNQYGSDVESITIIYNPKQTEQPPVVFFVDPNVNPYTTTQNTFAIQASVLNVAGSQNVTFKQNGSSNQNFTFNPSTHDFTSNVVLNPGQNVFEIIGVNTAGTASATTIIIYERQAPKPPIVTITDPSSNPQETFNAVYNLSATVLNVTQASQVKVKLNGANLTNFTFTPGTNAVTASLNLVLGTNVVQVTGTNSDGTDSKQTTIIYKRQQMVQPPVVTFTAPNVDPFTTQQGSYGVAATILNVTDPAGVNVNVNGSNYTGFSFNPSNNQVILPLTLIEGANVITITGTNTAGTDTEPQTIIYRKPAPVQPPVVNFADPAINPTTVFDQNYNVRARVRFVATAQQITLKINGQVSTNFVYTASSEQMSFTTGLVAGANIIEITATNSSGSDQESTTIIYRQPNPTLPPVVTITNPAANPHTVNVASAPVTATVLNVDGAQNITVTVNGTPLSNFDYNHHTKQVIFTANLNQGTNTVTVSATNSAGQASDSHTLVFKREAVVAPPLVTFINPAVSGTPVLSAGFTMKARITNVDQQGQVIVLQDGQVISAGLWNFDPSSKQVTFNTNLNTGNNIFTVTGTNAGGTHSATAQVYYKAPAPCEKPTVSIINRTNGAPQTEPTMVVVATIDRISSVNEVKLLLNGVIQSPGTYNAAAKQYTKEIRMVEGQNIVEITATNSCGATNGSTTYSHRPAAAPCPAPAIQAIQPTTQVSTIMSGSTEVIAGFSNVTDGSQVTAVVDGNPTEVYYEAARHMAGISARFAPGQHIVTFTATTPCGTTSYTWTINSQGCTDPVITPTSLTAENGATVTATSFRLMAGVTGIADNSQIKVSHNGENVGFVFSPQTGVLTLDRPLAIGVNRFQILAKNDCNEAKYGITVTRKEVNVVKPPTLGIITPATTPFTTQQAEMEVIVAVGGVIAASELSIKVNGVTTNFELDVAKGRAVFNARLQQGANVVTATAANAGGTASDTKTIIYTAPVVSNPPVITIKNPASCPATFKKGTVTISGTVTNVTNPADVQISFNNASVNFRHTIAGNVLTFTFILTISETTVNSQLNIVAKNAAGAKAEKCVISVLEDPKTVVKPTAPVVPPVTPPSSPQPTKPTKPATPTVKPGDINIPKPAGTTKPAPAKP